jgi:2-polyprenyl-3-methyl-5-hydroxy-6-metoxy-1,4-benzoquinol methylase
MTTAGVVTRSNAGQPGGIAFRVKHGIRQVVPLRARKQLAVWMGRQQWLPQRHWWSNELVRDLAERDIAEYHRFLWSNHLAYAQTYEVEQRFGPVRMHPTRVMLFEGLCSLLEERGLQPAQVDSVLEVGCSMGYLLHHLEQYVFAQASVLDGVDVDEYAIEQGREYLHSVNSRIRLLSLDMKELHRLEQRRYDLVICAGVLMYVPQPEALNVVREMLERSSGLLVLAGLAHPEQDNRTLKESVPRDSDCSFIHNLDAMVECAGGRVVQRRWEGARTIQGNTVYFVYAEPGHGPATPGVKLG